MGYYFDKETNIKSEEKKVLVKIVNQEYTFFTDNNVFSKKGLDFGTRTLLENIDLSEISGDVLDFGCGYGPIGIYVASNTTCDVDMVDINERALNLSRKNAMINKVSVNVFFSDIYSEVSKKYDFIISNPPIRVGKLVLESILFGAKDYLKSGGSLIIVVNKDQGAKSLSKKLESIYKVKVVAKNKGFFVIKCQKYWQVDESLIKL